MRLLIAEDDPVIGLTLEQTLAGLGHEVLSRVGDGRRAVEEAERTSPDAIVMDLMMPGMDGIAACRAIALRRRVPVVAITAYDNPALVQASIDAGVAAYLVKPVTARQVDSAIRLAVSRHEEFEAMREEVGRLSDALQTRKLVERAKGVLMARSGYSEHEAFARIQRRARDSNRRMAEVAREIIEADRLLS